MWYAWTEAQLNQHDLQRLGARATGAQPNHLQRGGLRRDRENTQEIHFSGPGAATAVVEGRRWIERRHWILFHEPAGAPFRT